jgi:putative addiction module CopG family antidote
MSFPLPPEFERAVLDRVRSGQFESPEAVLAAMLELLKDAEAEHEEKLEALRREIDLGLESEKRDPMIPGEEVEAWLHARIGGGAR